MKQSAIELRAVDLDPIGKQKGTMELARRNAAIEVDGAVVFGLPAPDVQLVALDGDVQIALARTRPRRG